MNDDLLPLDPLALPAVTEEARAVAAPQAVVHASDAYRRQVAAVMVLGHTDTVALGHLLKAREPLTQTELARRLGITTGAATALVDRLTREGLAERHADRHD